MASISDWILFILLKTFFFFFCSYPNLIEEKTLTNVAVKCSDILRGIFVGFKIAIIFKFCQKNKINKKVLEMVKSSELAKV